MFSPFLRSTLDRLLEDTSSKPSESHRAVQELPAHRLSKGSSLTPNTQNHVNLTLVCFRFLVYRDPMVVVDTISQGAPQQVAALSERTSRALLNIVRDNFNTQYASKAASLAGFRDAVSAHGGTEADAALLADFQSHVPLSNYDAYKPFLDKFNARPCKEEDVDNLLSPGLPDFFAVSSATSGTTPKILPKYDHNARLKIPTRQIFDPNSTPFAALMCTQYRDVKEIERAPGQVVQRIPVCLATGGILRRVLRRYIDDESRMSLPCTLIPFYLR